MKIFHASDLHYCPKHLHWVDKAFRHAVADAIDARCDVAVIAGDSFDASMGIHEPAVSAYLEAIIGLASYMPVLVLQGTYSHDRPGSLDILKPLSTPYPVYVADEPGQLILQAGCWYPYDGDLTNMARDGSDAVFSVLPSLNKADPRVMEHGARDYVRRLLTGWSPNNIQARRNSIPTMLVTHGTVTGCRTESGYAMVAPDHEFDEDRLYSAGADAVMLGHIHAHQRWANDHQVISYPGSIARLVHGDHEDKGFLIWDVMPDHPTFEFITTPTRQLLEIEFDGPPVMEDLAKLASRADDDTDVRIRWSVDQEHAHSIDKKAIRELFSVAAGVKLEGTVNPVQSARAAGIGSAMTLEEKLGYFAVTTGDEDRLDDLTTRLQMLQTMDVERIVDLVLSRDETKGEILNRIADG